MNVLTVLWAETYKELIESRRYTLNLALSIIVQTIIFMGILFLAVSFSPIRTPEAVARTAEVKSFLLIGYIVWTFAMFAVNNMGQDVTTEMVLGTFEQKYMASVSPVVVLAGRALGNVVVSVIYTGVLLPVLILISGVRLSIPWTVFPVLGVTLVGLYGLGYILAGMALLFKRVGQASYAVQLVLLFFGGFTNPGEAGGVVGGFSRALPLTPGVEVIRSLVLDGARLGSLVSTGAVTRLLVNAAAYLAVGLAVFCLCDRVARRRGCIGKY
ncbi:MAG: ABC transporter permease [Acetobacteraceae bacterium]|nr:ABC transporter permease [Acetobacteraceae bacterium]